MRGHAALLRQTTLRFGRHYPCNDLFLLLQLISIVKQPDGAAKVQRQNCGATAALLGAGVSIVIVVANFASFFDASLCKDSVGVGRDWVKGLGTEM